MKRYLISVFFLLSMVCCGPRKTANLHVLSIKEANQGRALPMHVVPLDDIIKAKLATMSAEDYFLSKEVENLTGIQKKVLRGAQKELVVVSRANQKNDFLVIVDFADVTGSDRQKLEIGDRFYSAKDIYVLVSSDDIRFVTKKVYEDYLKSSGY